MHKNLAVILQQLCNGKISFMALVPSLLESRVSDLVQLRDGLDEGRQEVLQANVKIEARNGYNRCTKFHRILQTE